MVGERYVQTLTAPEPTGFFNLSHHHSLTWSGRLGPASDATRGVTGRVTFDQDVRITRVCRTTSEEKVGVHMSCTRLTIGIHVG